VNRGTFSGLDGDQQRTRGGFGAAAWYTEGMRYHKAVKVTKPEADYIIGSGTASLTDTVVLSHMDSWYDVRAMTSAELEAFVADLARAELAEQKARAFPPH
jgi:hypothetical protein